MPALQEEEESSLHFRARCAATTRTRSDIFVAHLLDYVELSRVQWFSLMEFAKASEKF